MSEERILTTDDVAIKTLAIEVKVMKIGKRQVTLAVFRQLPSENLIDRNTGKLRGIPWGRVNYHVDCSAVEDYHIHVVWQKGNELRKSVVYGLYFGGLSKGEDASRQAILNYGQSFDRLSGLDQLFIAV